MIKIKILIFCLFLFIFSSCDNIKYDGLSLEKIITDNVKNPECVYYDKETKTLFISNVNGGTSDFDGNGYVSQYDINGKILNEKLVNKLNAPKGIYIKEGLMHITDINRLVLFDLRKQGRDTVFTVEDSESLNDVVVDETGKIFISDFYANKIFIINKKNISSLSIKKPNGLYIYDGFLYVGTFQKHTNGHIYRSSLSNNQILFESFLNGFGYCDGLYVDDNIVAISNFNNSIKIIDIDSRKVISSVESSNSTNYGDFYYNSEIIVSPSLTNSQIHFLRID